MKENLNNLFKNKKKVGLITTVCSLIIVIIAGILVTINIESKELAKESVEKTVEEHSEETNNQQENTLKVEEDKSQEDKGDIKEESEVSGNSSEASVSNVTQYDEDYVTESKETEAIEPNTSESSSDENDPLSAEAIAKAYPKVKTIGPDAPRPIEDRAALNQGHNHSWIDWVGEITIPEQGHYEQVIVVPGKVRQAPIYEKREVEICNGCGADITGNASSHIESEALKGNNSCSGYTTNYIDVQVDTIEEFSGSVYENKWVVDK